MSEAEIVIISLLLSSLSLSLSSSLFGVVLFEPTLTLNPLNKCGGQVHWFSVLPITQMNSCIVCVWERLFVPRSVIDCFVCSIHFSCNSLLLEQGSPWKPQGDITLVEMHFFTASSWFPCKISILQGTPTYFLLYIWFQNMDRRNKSVRVGKNS